MLGVGEWVSERVTGRRGRSGGREGIGRADRPGATLRHPSGLAQPFNGLAQPFTIPPFIIHPSIISHPSPSFSSHPQPSSSIHIHPQTGISIPVRSFRPGVP